MIASTAARVALAAIFWATAGISPAEAQFGGFADKLKRKVERAVERETDKQVDEAIDTAVKCVVGDQACAEQAARDGKPVEIVDADGKPATSAAPSTAKAASQAAPGEGVWRNYDYVPGRTVWFSTDFSGDKMGRFPASLEFVKGNAQVVEQGGVRLLEVKDYTEFKVRLPGTLPPDFSLEVTAQTGAPNIGIDILFSEAPGNLRGYDSHYLRLFRDAGIYYKMGTVSVVDNLWKVSTERIPFRFQADGDYAILYAGVERVANMPNATFKRSKNVYFRVHANGNRPAYIERIEVAVGVDELYASLASTGEFTTRGILFAFDSDQLRPESTPTLGQLYDALAGHADLAVTIEGHTDDQGDADYNQKLSARRAASVVAYLTGRGIAASRLTAVGKGESEPAVRESTPEAREQNRRVVIRVTN